MEVSRYKQLVRASAIYDLAVTAGFATPWTFHVVHQLLGTISPLPAFEPIHVLLLRSSAFLHLADVLPHSHGRFPNSLGFCCI